MPKRLLKKQRPPDSQIISVSGFDLVLKRSARRRTLTIRVEGGQVQVRAPIFVPLGEIKQFISRKQAWIQEKVTHQQRQLDASRRYWQSGEYLPLLGREICLQVVYGPKGEVSLSEGTLYVQLRRPATEEAGARRVQALVQQWYRDYARQHFAQRVEHWQRVTGIKARAQCVKTYKARWGSCNHRAEVSFNWKLIMAPPDVIDYVVVHELCHIVHFDHSPAFWRLAAVYQPQFKTHKAWLRRHGLTLEL